MSRFRARRSSRSNVIAKNSGLERFAVHSSLIRLVFANFLYRTSFPNNTTERSIEYLVYFHTKYLNDLKHKIPEFRWPRPGYVAGLARRPRGQLTPAGGGPGRAGDKARPPPQTREQSASPAGNQGDKARPRQTKHVPGRQTDRLRKADRGCTSSGVSPLTVGSQSVVAGTRRAHTIKQSHSHSRTTVGITGVTDQSESGGAHPTPSLLHASLPSSLSLQSSIYSLHLPPRTGIHRTQPCPCRRSAGTQPRPPRAAPPGRHPRPHR